METFSGFEKVPYKRKRGIEMNQEQFKEALKESIDNEYNFRSTSKWDYIQKSISHKEAKSFNRNYLRYVSGIAAAVICILFISITINQGAYNRKGVFIVKNGDIAITNNCGGQTECIILHSMEMIEKEYERLKESYDTLIIRGKKVFSTSYYTGKRLEDGYDQASITVSKIKVIEVFDESGVNLKDGDIIDIYEYYYFEPTEFGEYKFVHYYCGVGFYPPALDEDEYLLILHKERDKDKWFTQHFFRIDYLSLMARDVGDWRVLFDRRSEYFLTPDENEVYPEIFRKYLSHLNKEDYTYIPYVLPTEKPTSKPGEITPLPVITPMPVDF